jgi:hypothetical protein
MAEMLDESGTTPNTQAFPAIMTSAPHAARAKILVEIVITMLVDSYLREHGTKCRTRRAPVW